MALWVMTLQDKLDLSTNLPHLNVHFGKRFDWFIYNIRIKRKLFMTLISIILWPFKVLKVGKRFFFWLRTSNGFGFIYIWKEIKVEIYILFFELESYKLFKNNFFYLKHLPSIASYHSQNILFLTKFTGKIKYYRELISYE